MLVRFFFFFLSFFLGCSFELKAVIVSHLRVNAVKNPSGVNGKILFSWQLLSTQYACYQSSYQIVITEDNGTMVYDSGNIESSQSINVELEGLNLRPSCRYYWNVSIVDNYGNYATSTEKAFFETGLMENGWNGAQWITNKKIDGSVPRFKKAINISKEINSAYLYTSALGIYDVYINSKRVGHSYVGDTTLYEELKPGWTDYRKTVNYSTHNITSYLQKGSNIVGAIVANGWWKGRISVGAYGNKPIGFIAKILINYTDNTSDIIVTDNSWLTNTTGPLLSGDIWDGEVYDATKEDEWMINDSSTELWYPSQIINDYSGDIKPIIGGQVYTLPQNIQYPKSINIYENISSNGTDYGCINIVEQYKKNTPIFLREDRGAIIDFGQNIVGWTPFLIKAPRGTKMVVRYAEMLNDDGSKLRGNDGPGGSLYRENLRSAKATLSYIFRGDASGEGHTPFSTYFGFRYCEITADKDIEIIDIHGVPISSINEEYSTILTNSQSLNQLLSNIQWGQRGNMISIPTDCPQRDERYGWTGDSQAFSRTGMYNADTEAFYKKYLSDLRDAQREDGAYPDMCPPAYEWYGNAGWGDAGIIIPYNVYLMYGNKDILKEHFESMEKYMTWLSTRVEDNYKYPGAGVEYGDWLAYNKCDNRYVSVAFYAYDAKLMHIMSKALSEKDNDVFDTKAKEYASLFDNIKKEFNTRYWNPLPTESTQTTYLLPLSFDLLDTDKAEIAKALLEQSIKDNNGLLSTGFLGTSILLPTLSKVGLNEEAYDLISQRDNPSWLYSIDQGATTIWERWDSYTKENGFGPASMNSFNHYAYGAVGEWMYRYMAGIDVDESIPGFKHIILKPIFDTRIKSTTSIERIRNIKSQIHSKYGVIKSSWDQDDNNCINYFCSIPANSTATLFLPEIVSNDESYKWSTIGIEQEKTPIVEDNENYCKYELPSGDYHFVYSVNATKVIEMKSSNQSQFIELSNGKIHFVNDEICKVELYYIDGRILDSWANISGTIDVSNIVKGCYIIKVSTFNDSNVFKVMIK